MPVLLLAAASFLFFLFVVVLLCIANTLESRTLRRKRILTQAKPLVWHTRPQQVPSSAEEHRQERFTDALEHADADKLVVLLAVVNVPVVRDFHAASIIQP